MSDFIIPQGKEFIFTITVMEKDSFLPQDVTTFDPTISSIVFRDLEQDTLITPNTGDPDCTMIKLPDDATVSPVTYRQGRIKVTVPYGITSLLIPQRGDKVDGYYLKPTHEAVITVGFTDVNIPTRTVILQDIYVIPTT